MAAIESESQLQRDDDDSTGIRMEREKNRVLS